MFARASTVIFAIAAVVLAVPGTAAESSQCDTGPVQCCNSIMNATDPNAASLLGVLGIVLDPNTDALVGLNCSPITVIGTGSGASCVQQPVCCTDVQQYGLVNTGCTPINLDL